MVAFGGGGALLSRAPAPLLCLFAALLALGAGLAVGFLRNPRTAATLATARPNPATSAQRVSGGSADTVD